MENKKTLKELSIHNRRYLGNKYSLTNFIKETVNNHCNNIHSVMDIFSGTGSVSNIFKDKKLITNDLLYSNYISNCAWFYPEDYRKDIIIKIVEEYNDIETTENNYMRQNFANTFFSADDCSKIGYIREDIERKYTHKLINFKEYSILITILLYAMDRIANTVGHYDAYRKTNHFEKKLVLSLILPTKNLQDNQCYNKDANQLIKEISCDLLYLDPPYNSRQYSDTYHLLENVAQWQKPEVFGIARKMNRSHLKSEYCRTNAAKAFEDLIHNAKAKYILLSYNNMSEKGNARSNAKIADSDIIRVLSKKGKVSIFEKEYKSFSTGKTNVNDNKERLFLCKCFQDKYIPSPFNYMGSKFKLLDQIIPLFPNSKKFLDLFAGSGTVGINSKSSKIILNDKNTQLIELISYIRETDLSTIINKLNKIIDTFNLSNTSTNGYSFYHCNSSIGLAEYNKSHFLELRETYNKLCHSNVENKYILLYALIIFSFNNQIRFNRKGEFNLPVGKRDFNDNMLKKLILFSNRIKEKNIIFKSLDFRNINLDEVDQDTFIYCDPPYLITNATYNENNAWTQNDEIDLLEFLNIANKKGFKFALSNVLISKNKENSLLIQWIKQNNYTCHYLNKNYANSNYQRKNKDTITQEVLITNY